MFFEFSIGFASFYFYKANKFIFRKITESDSRRYENKEGKLHREDGPVVESLDGTKEWFVDGKNLTEQQFNDYVNSKSTMIVEKDGTKIWKNKEGQYHRVDGPAIEYASGSKEWYFNGFFHHEDGPACEYADGTKHWYINGNLHRTDGPAVEWSSGTKEWFVNGLLHREDGPAIEYADGVKQWFLGGKEFSEKEFNDCFNPNSTMIVDADGTKRWINKKGQHHRTDGPAIEWADGSKSWYIEDKNLTQHQFNDYVNSKSTMTVDKYGHKLWKNQKGQYHREDGPAIEYASGSKEWYLYGKLHREDGPAVENCDGNKKWIVDGKLHRIDGPAIECANGTKKWWIDGKEFTEQQFNEYLNSKSTMIVDSVGTKRWINKEGLLHRIDGHAVEYLSGAKHWYLNGNRHRTDGPALEWADGTKQWYVNGERHRTDGPACEYVNGKKIWFVNNKELTEQQFNDYMSFKSTMTVNSSGTKHWKNNKGQLHRVDGPAVEFVNGTKQWYINGKRHREDGPAIEWHHGTKKWFINGEPFSESDFNDYVNSKSTMTFDTYGHKLWKNKEGKYHRVDGPAVEGKDGSKSWFANGKRHREDGPACEYANGTKLWFIDGKELTEQQFNDYANSKSTMAVDKYGNKFWKNNKGQLHRVNGPALEWTDGTKQWFVNGDRHREDGPAVEWSRGGKEWWENGKLIKIC